MWSVYSFTLIEVGGKRQPVCSLRIHWSMRVWRCLGAQFLFDDYRSSYYARIYSTEFSCNMLHICLFRCVCGSLIFQNYCNKHWRLYTFFWSNRRGKAKNDCENCWIDEKRKRSLSLLIPFYFAISQKSIITISILRFFFFSSSSNLFILLPFFFFYRKCCLCVSRRALKNVIYTRSREVYKDRGSIE